MRSTPTISAIAAIGAYNRALCEGNNLLWQISEDLKRVKKLTTNHPIIMGRKTFESIGKPLPNRTNIVVTKKQNLSSLNGHDIRIAHSIDEAIALAQSLDREEIFIFGGAQMYQQSMQYIEKLYLTLVYDKAREEQGTQFFPAYEDDFKTIELTEHESHERMQDRNIRYTWETLVKK